jgi:acyl dehydratase
MRGLYFEEFEVGMTFDHAVRRTITETDNVMFAAMTMNVSPLHLDFDYCSRTEFGKPLVNGMFTLALLVGLTIADTTFKTTVANLGMNDVRFPAPVFHGDTIRASTEVKALRASKSRPDAGVVEFVHRAFNQRGEEVATCGRYALMMRSEAAAA